MLIHFVTFGKCISCKLKMNIIFVTSGVSLIHRAGLQRNGTLGNPNSCSNPPPPTPHPPTRHHFVQHYPFWLSKPLYHHNSNMDDEDDDDDGGEENDNLTVLCCIFRFVQPYVPLSCTLTCTQWKNGWSRVQVLAARCKVVHHLGILL